MRSVPNGPSPATIFTPPTDDGGISPSPPRKRFLAYALASEMRRSRSPATEEHLAYCFCQEHIRPQRSLEHNVKTLRRDVALAVGHLDDRRAEVLRAACADVSGHLPDYWAQQTRMADNAELIDAYFAQGPHFTPAYAMARACFAGLLGGQGGRHQATGRVLGVRSRLGRMAPEGSAAQEALAAAHRSLLDHLGPAPAPEAGLAARARAVAGNMNRSSSTTWALKLATIYFSDAIVITEELEGNVGRIADHAEALVNFLLPGLAPSVMAAAADVQARAGQILERKRAAARGSQGLGGGGFGGGGGGGGGGCGGGGCG